MHLEIKNLVKFYKKELPIIKKLNFSVNKGNIISFIGESGSGKTTLLKCISGLEKINSGSIVGPGLKGAKGKAKSFPLESFYDNDEVKKLLWTKSCEAIGENFEI